MSVFLFFSSKGAIAGIIKHPYAHRVILAFLNNVDDTVLLKKSLLAEIEKDLVDVCCDQFGSKVLTHILAPEKLKNFSEADKAVIAETLVPVLDTDGKYVEGQMQVRACLLNLFL